MRLNRIGLGAAVAVAIGAAGVVPGTAGAAFPTTDDSTCESSTTAAYSIVGGGATFAREAQLAWGAEVTSPAAGPNPVGFGYAFTSPLCSAYQVGGTARVLYHALGSGAGRSAFGANGAVRAVTDERHRGAVVAANGGAPVNFGGTDEAPTQIQLDNAREGDPSTTADDTPLHTIPVAQSSIAVDVQLPTGCSVDHGTGVDQRRIARGAVENAFAGDASVDTWGELFGTVAVSGTAGGVNCDDIVFSRVVRQDSSGTTFQFKRYLERINPARWSGLANTAWPNPGSERRAATAGAPAQLAFLSTLTGTSTSGSITTGGGIAYADLASSRRAGFNWNGASDTAFWAYVQQVSPNNGYFGPAFGASGDTSSSATGANCRTAAYLDSVTGRLPGSTTATWFNVDATQTSLTYPICALTYALAWEDAVPVNNGIPGTANDLTMEEQRSTIDRLWYIVQDTATGRCGQDALIADDYMSLPANVRTIAQTGVRRLTWNGAAAQTYATC